MPRQIITQSLVKEYFDYNPGGYLTRKKHIARMKAGTRFGGIDAYGYISGNFLANAIKEHQLVFILHHGYMPKNIDHINRVRHDNRIENIREVTRSQNQQNRPKQANNTSGFKGVSFLSKRGKYLAKINMNYKPHHLGVYDTPEEAHEAYCIAAKRLHGEFACVD